MTFDPYAVKDFLKAHKLMTQNLLTTIAANYGISGHGEGLATQFLEVYEPFAAHEFQDEALHIFDMKSKHGFGWRSTRHYPAKAGDKVR